jgi:hypothetical protein
MDVSDMAGMADMDSAAWQLADLPGAEDDAFAQISGLAAAPPPPLDREAASTAGPDAASGGGGGAPVAARKRRRRETKEELAALYALYHARIPKSPTAEAMHGEFADKELRVIVSQNGVVLNDHNESTGKYTEKTKIRKIETVLAMIASGTLIEPNALQQDVNRHLTRLDSVTTKAAPKKAPTKAKAAAAAAAAGGTTESLKSFSDDALREAVRAFSNLPHLRPLLLWLCAPVRIDARASC